MGRLPALDTRPIGWRKLHPGDLDGLARWLATGEVARWYAHGEAVDEAAVREAYFPDPPDVTRRYAITYDGRAIGYAQIYLHRDEQAYWGWLGMAEAAGVDLFIGEPDFQHRGLGTAFLQRFVPEEVLRIPGVTACLIDPQPANAAAIRCYEKAGFREFDPGMPVPAALGPTWLGRWAGAAD
jgi:GNAT superfamily N-acetyltransferase